MLTDKQIDAAWLGSVVEADEQPRYRIFARIVEQRAREAQREEDVRLLNTRWDGNGEWLSAQPLEKP